MMNIQKINWKVFIEEPAIVAADDFFRVFNEWIPNSPEIFVDVANYKHVHDGPLTVLTGYYVDYIFDASDSRPGIVYSQKQPVDGDNLTKLGTSLARTLSSCARLSAAKVFSGKLKFVTDEFLFTINDRAIAPNTKETFNLLKADLDNFFAKLYGKGGFSLHYKSHPKKRFSVSVFGNRDVNLEDLRKRLQ